jgi:hypothetical protein
METAVSLHCSSHCCLLILFSKPPCAVPALLFFSMQCAKGYGLSTDKTQCNKCTSSACADCPGNNPSVCKTPINNKPIPNCSYGDDNNEECFDCDDGYIPTADSKACFKCTAPNCSNCSPSKPAVCTGVRNSFLPFCGHRQLKFVLIFSKMFCFAVFLRV